MTTTATIAATPEQVGLFNYPECTFTTTGLLIPEGMPFARWEALGDDLRKAAKGVQFWIGDWIRYGQHSYGEKYAQAINATGRDEQTLMNYVYVAENVEIYRRRENVDYSKHAEVASLTPEQQSDVLEQAEKENLTVKQVRRVASRIKRMQGRDKSEIELLQSVDVQQFLERYINTLKEYEEQVPITARFLRGMIQAHTAQAHWQKNRTIVDDCDAIMLPINRYGAVSEEDLYTWLNEHGYFMSDPELDERLEYMQRDDVRLLSKTDAGDGKQADRRGKLPQIYVKWFKSWREHYKDYRQVDAEDDF